MIAVARQHAGTLPPIQPLKPSLRDWKALVLIDLPAGRAVGSDDFTFTYYERPLLRYHAETFKFHGFRQDDAIIS